MPRGATADLVCEHSSPAWSRQELLAQLDPFVAVFKNRPGGATKVGGGGIMHHFALWCMLHLLPDVRHVVESGSFSGVGSWILRQSAPDAQMTFVTPRAMPDMYIDTKPGTVYFTPPYFRGPHADADRQRTRDAHVPMRGFRDFADVRWDRQLPDAAVRRDQTFIFFDDHQAALRRAVDAARWGFRHVAFDDNYLPGASDNFALNHICHGDTRLWDALGTAPAWVDNFGHAEGAPPPFRGHVALNRTKQWFPGGAPLDASAFTKLARIYRGTVERYFEFPPLWAPLNHSLGVDGSLEGRGQREAHSGQGKRLYGRVTKPPLLSREEAARLLEKHGLAQLVDLEDEARIYNRIVYARLAPGGGDEPLPRVW